MFFFIYLHCEINHKSPYNLRFGPGKVLEKSLVLIHQNLWEPGVPKKGLQDGGDRTQKFTHKITIWHRYQFLDITK